MSAEPNPAQILGRLADERRLRVLSAVALGATSVSEVAERAGVSENEAARGLAQLVKAGVVQQTEEGLTVDLAAFTCAARAASKPRKRADLGDATPEQAVVLRNFVDGEGRITELPARASKRRLVLEYVADRFEPGREYPERDVNGLLLSVYDDRRRCDASSSTRASSHARPASTGASRPRSEAAPTLPRRAGSSAGRAGDF